MNRVIDPGLCRLHIFAYGAPGGPDSSIVMIGGGPTCGTTEKALQAEGRSFFRLEDNEVEFSAENEILNLLDRTIGESGAVAAFLVDVGSWILPVSVIHPTDREYTYDEENFNLAVQEANLRIVKAASNFISKDGMIVIAGTWVDLSGDWTGKGGLAVQWLKENGFKVDPEYRDIGCNYVSSCAVVRRRKQ